MTGGIKRLRRVALSTEVVTFGLQSRGVRIMTIRAQNSFGRHSALEKRSDLEDLVADLTVNEIQPVHGKLWPPGLEHRFKAAG